MKKISFPRVILLMIALAFIAAAGFEVPVFYERFKDQETTLCLERAKAAFVSIGQTHKAVPATFEEYLKSKQTSEEIFRSLGKEVPEFPPYADEKNFYRGSGMIIDEDGYILTVAHLLAEDLPMFAEYHDKRYSARVVGLDLFHDLLLLKIDVTKKDEATSLRLHKVKNLKIGHTVFTLGNPSDGINRFNKTISKGIVGNIDTMVTVVGADNRSINDHMVATDAVIHGGNSGGPLLRCIGKDPEIVGVIESKLGGFSLAVSIETTLREVSRMRNKTLSHGLLGIKAKSLRDLGLEFKYHNSVPFNQEGVWVDEVISQSGAEKAGILPGDILVAFDGHYMSNFFEIGALIGDRRAGEVLEITLLRSGSVLTKKVILGERADRSRFINEL